MRLTLISALPRSRSAWLARWLATAGPGVRVLHDPSRGCGSVAEYLGRVRSSEFRGGSSETPDLTVVVDTALPWLWRPVWAALPSSELVRWATLWRPRAEVYASLLKMPPYRGLPPLTPEQAHHVCGEGYLGQHELAPLAHHRIQSASLLSHESTARRVWGYVLHELSHFDPHAWGEATTFRVLADTANLDPHLEAAARLAAEVRGWKGSSETTK